MSRKISYLVINDLIITFCQNLLRDFILLQITEVDRMVHLDKLKQLTTTKYSGVKSVKKQIHLALEPRFLDNIKFGILKHLNNHLHEYFPE